MMFKSKEDVTLSHCKQAIRVELLNKCEIVSGYVSNATLTFAILSFIRIQITLLDSLLFFRPFPSKRSQ